ncbi:MAG: hypothetical protein HQL37_08035 [Alphaproteobacteria bacterium]|nr:hypothetical protein [Alphaproteobacteria bacterium]
MTDTTMTKSDFARSVNLSAARISQLIALGLPVRPDGKIDPEPALAWMEDTLDRSHRRGTRQAPPTPRLAPSAPTPAPAEPPRPATPMNMSHAEIRRMLDLVRVQRAKLDLEKEKGELVSRNVIRGELFAWARQERDAWLAWSRRVAPLLAAEVQGDAGAVFALLDRHVREQLSDLAQPRIESA